VSKHWKLAASSALWRDPLDHELDATKESLIDLTRFKECLTQNPQNGQLVRRLDLLDYSDYLIAHDSWVTATAASCPNLRYIRFGGDITFQSVPLLAIYHFCVLCPNLVDLELTFLVSDQVDTEVESTQDQDESPIQNQPNFDGINNFLTDVVVAVTDLDMESLENIPNPSSDDGDDGNDGNDGTRHPPTYKKLAQALSAIDTSKFTQALNRLQRLSWMVEMKTTWTHHLARLITNGARNLQTLLIGESQDDLSRTVLRGLAPHTQNLSVFSHTGGENADEDEDILIRIATSSPKLTQLALWGCDQVPRVVVDTFVLNCRKLEMIRLDFLSDHDSIDDILVGLALHCPKLVSLSVPGLHFSSKTLVDFIHRRGRNLKFLDLSRCLEVKADSDGVVMAISQSARNLSTLIMSGCPSVSDFCIRDLLETSRCLTTFVLPTLDGISAETIQHMKARWRLQWRP
jgi:hypothetical protein